MANFPLSSGAVSRRNVTGVIAAGRKFSPSSNLAVNDTIEICKMPVGAYPVFMFVGHDVANSMTVDVGDGTDANAYMSGVVVASGAVGTLDEGATGLAAQTSSEVTVTLTVTAITTPNTTGTLNVVVLYTMDLE